MRADAAAAHWQRLPQTSVQQASGRTDTAHRGVAASRALTRLQEGEAAGQMHESCAAVKRRLGPAVLAASETVWLHRHGLEADAQSMAHLYPLRTVRLPAHVQLDDSSKLLRILRANPSTGRGGPSFRQAAAFHSLGVLELCARKLAIVQPRVRLAGSERAVRQALR